MTGPGRASAAKHPTPAALKDVIQNLLRLDAQNLVPEMIGAAIVAWLVVVALTLSSIISLDVSRWVKAFWILVVVLLPLVGLLFYCVYSLFKQDHSVVAGFLTLRNAAREKKNKRRVARRAARLQAPRVIITEVDEPAADSERAEGNRK